MEQPGVSGQGGYEVGSRALCLASMDNLHHAVDIVERKKGDTGPSMYYVHYIEHDKRLDEWVSEDRLLPADNAGLPSVPSLVPNLLLGEGPPKVTTRRNQRKQDEINHRQLDLSQLAPLDQAAEKEHHEKTKVKNIKVVELGRYEIATWYWSPYPEPFASKEKLYLCEFCLKYFRKLTTLCHHMAKCDLTHPPGDEIYRSPPPDRREEGNACFVDPAIAVFEVDGKKQKVYCQSLCLLSKLFLDHKTLYYDVDPFLFYVLTEKDEYGYHIVGYFSKEKASTEGYNLACILTLPPYQRKGYGRFLIAFSYELSRMDGKMGTPERPLSDLGAVSYRSYWTRVLLEAIRKNSSSMSIKDLSDMTNIRSDDVVATLTSLSMVRYWRGDHILVATSKIVEDHLKTIANQQTIEIDRGRMHYTPYVGTASTVRRV